MSTKTQTISPEEREKLEEFVNTISQNEDARLTLSTIIKEWSETEES